MVTMIPVDGEFIYKVASRLSGNRGARQARIVGAISGVFAPVLDEYQINNR